MPTTEGMSEDHPHDIHINQGPVSIDLLDGTCAPVHAELRPMLVEWDWTTNAQGMVVRASQDHSAVPLFEEHLRLATRHQHITDHPLIPRDHLRRQLGQHPDYESLIVLTTKQREFAIGEFGMELPPTSVLLNAAVLHLLYGYFKWQHKRTRVTYKADPSHLVPGTFTETVVKSLPQYKTLGEWAKKEFSGGWTAAPRARTGLLPTNYAKKANAAMRETWRVWVYYTNEHSPTFALEDSLNEKGISVQDTIKLTLKIADSYKPTPP